MRFEDVVMLDYWVEMSFSYIRSKYYTLIVLLKY